MRASRTAPARWPVACCVKYETVIGTIGKTQGVKSDSAPTVIASQMNDQKDRLKSCCGDTVPKVSGPFTAAGLCIDVLSLSCVIAAGGCTASLFDVRIFYLRRSLDNWISRDRLRSLGGFC